VLDATDALDPHLPRPCRHRVVRLRGENEVFDPDLVEAPQPVRIGTAPGDALLAAVVRPYAVVREDPVEVEDDEADLRERRHVSRAARGEASGTRWASRMASSSSRGRASVRPSRPSSSYGGMPSSAGDLASRSPDARRGPAE